MTAVPPPPPTDAAQPDEAPLAPALSPATPPLASLPPVVSPTRTDPFARWASPLLGGPAGRRVAYPAHRWWTAARVLVLLAALSTGLGLAQKNDCRDRGWINPDQFVHACYSNLPIEYAGAGSTVAGVLGYGGAENGVSHPVVSSVVMAGIAAVTNAVAPAFGGDEVRGRVFFDVSAVVLALVAAVMVFALTRLTRRRPWDVTLVAVSPVLVLTGLVSIDLLGVALGVIAVWLWSRDRPLWAGAVLGLAVAARFHVLLIAVALVIVALRQPRWREVTATLGTALAVWLAVNLPWLVSAPDAFLAPVRAWTDTAPGYGSLMFLPTLVSQSQLQWGRPLTPGESTAVGAMGLAVVIVVVAVWVLTATRTPRLPAVILMLLVGSLLVSKAVPVQAAVWVLPWAALAVPRWRPHLWWWAFEALYFIAVWQYLVSLTDVNRALPAGYYAVLMVTRLAALVWLASAAWRWAWRWGADPGRDPGVGGVRGRADDPAAGPFARPVVARAKPVRDPERDLIQA